MPRHETRATPSRTHSMSLVAALAMIVSLATTTATAPVARAAEPVEGIDVSHWQNEIDWPTVAASGKAFVFIKASEGTTYIDPTYGLNRVRAAAAGLHVGAYHFAKPDATPGDAVAEADHFLATASIAEGDLPPVLDLEVAGGLAPATLERWVRTYVERIRSRTGVRAAIYVSPNFWRQYVGDSGWFATNGYRTLWIAHWTTAPAPSVPADDWAGFGWTFWQYTSDGAVPGIIGRVDLNHFAGPSLGSVRIDALGPVVAPEPPFTDIDGTTFERDIAWLFGSGITAGCTPTRFCPDRTVTRGEMASFLARALRLPAAEEDHFTDDRGSTHEDNIDRIADAGLTSGCGRDRYCPDGSVTRGSLASFIARVLDLSATTTDYFDDDDGTVHEPNIDRIARAGLTNGCGPRRYCPSSALTRGQMAAFLHRTFGD